MVGSALVTPLPRLLPSQLPALWGQEDSWGRGGGGMWKSLGQMSPHLPAPLAPTNVKKASSPSLLPWADQPSWESPFLSSWTTGVGPGPLLVRKV